MPRTINEAIREKISHFPADVAELATEAVELAESLPEDSVSEKLESTVRRIIRAKKKTKT